MNYLVTVSDHTTVVEKVVFSYRDEALYFADARIKQGFIVTINTITAK